MKRTVMVSAKNTLKNSEFANEMATQLFNVASEMITDEVLAVMGIDPSLYGCVYRPASNGRVYSPKSMFLWAINMTLNSKETQVGISLRDGSRIEFSVQVSYTGTRLFVNVDKDSINYSRLNMINKAKVTGVAAAMVAACFI